MFTPEVAEYGYTVPDGIHTDEEAPKRSARSASSCRSTTALLRYQVKAAPGFEERRYSKSVNTILVHTEAPGWNPPPSYLALHCRVQATCGSGHTELADMRRFVDALSEKDRAALHERGIE